MISIDDNQYAQSIGDLKNQELRTHATLGISVTLAKFIEKPQYQFVSFIKDEEKKALKLFLKLTKDFK